MLWFLTTDPAQNRVALERARSASVPFVMADRKATDQDRTRTEAEQVGEGQTSGLHNILFIVHTRR